MGNSDTHDLVVLGEVVFLLFLSLLVDVAGETTSSGEV